MEDHRWSTIKFKDTVANSGIVLNLEKLQFCQKEMDIARFRIRENRVEPLPKYVEAIANFLSPGSISDVRAQFGLVQQVANYAKVRPLEEFRHLLMPKTPFCRSKMAIADEICNRVENFNSRRTTCLQMDYSPKGIGYILLQKHCAFRDMRPLEL